MQSMFYKHILQPAMSVHGWQVEPFKKYPPWQWVHVALLEHTEQPNNADEHKLQVEPSR